MKNRQDILNAAKSLIGYTNYKMGAKYHNFNNNPSKPKLLDCSGFVVWCYKQAGFNVPDGTYYQWQGSQAIRKEDLQIGDIGILKENGIGETNHVGIYAGNGYWIHCNYRRNGVTLERTDIFKFYRRFNNVIFQNEINTKKSISNEQEEEMVKPRIIEIEVNGRICTAYSINVDGHEYPMLQNLKTIGAFQDLQYNKDKKRPVIITK